MKIRFVWFGLILLVACGRGGDSGGTEQAAHAGHGESHEPGHAPGAAHEGHQQLAATAPAADTSLFQLTTAFTDQNDRAFAFESLRGHPTLVAMFYGSCETMCPIILEDIRAIDEALAPELRAKTRVLLVTFDPERDTSEKLRALVTERHFDPARTVVLRGDDGAVREMSMVLGVQYRKLPDGNFSHSALISLLDPEGRIVERIEGLHGPNEALIARMRAFP